MTRDLLQDLFPEKLDIDFKNKGYSYHGAYAASSLLRKKTLPRIITLYPADTKSS